jgi:hypothetical protein
VDGGDGWVTVLHRLFGGGSDRAADRWREDYAIDGIGVSISITTSWPSRVAVKPFGLWVHLTRLNQQKAIAALAHGT